MFKKNDKIKGVENPKHNYMVTNGKMHLAEVIKVDNEKGLMTIKILKHDWQEYNREVFTVYNSDEDFELVEKNK